MKKYLSIAAAAVIVFAACEEKAPKTIDVTVSVSEEKIEADMVKPEVYDVTLTNVGNSQVSEQQTAEGVATFTELLPGVYNVSVTGVITDNGVVYSYSASVASVELLEATDVPVVVEAVKQAALLFKEIYYTGCSSEEDPETGKKTTYFRDQFYEIYNNSDQTVYADGLCLSVLFGTTLNADYEYDIENPDDYVFTQLVWQVPGNGTDYPVKPGESFVIAQWATNHQAEGNAPWSPVNLSDAEFECITELVVSNGRETDTPAANLNLVYDPKTAVKMQWLSSVFGCYYVLYYPEKPISVEEDEIVATLTTSTYQVLPIRKSIIVDAVEAIKNEAENTNKKIFLPLDGGYIYCSGNYVGESIVRKVDHTEDNGRVVLKDTNNSSDDFEVSTTPTVRRYDVGKPSWN